MRNELRKVRRERKFREWRRKIVQRRRRSRRRWSARQGTRPLSNSCKHFENISIGSREWTAGGRVALSLGVICQPSQGGGDLSVHLERRVAWPNRSRSLLLPGWNLVNQVYNEEREREREERGRGERVSSPVEGGKRGSRWKFLLFPV